MQDFVKAVINKIILLDHRPHAQKKLTSRFFARVIQRTRKRCVRRPMITKDDARTRLHPASDGLKSQWRTLQIFVQALISKRLALEVESHDAIESAIDGIKTTIQLEVLISHAR
jgi:hypothetical protein